MTRNGRTSVYLLNQEKIINQTLEGFIRNLNYKIFILESVSRLMDILKKESVAKPLLIVGENVLKGTEKNILRKITKRFKRLNVILITETRPEISIKEAIEYRIYGFLHKPISLLELELLLVRMSE